MIDLSAINHQYDNGLTVHAVAHIIAGTKAAHQHRKRSKERERELLIKYDIALDDSVTIDFLREHGAVFIHYPRNPRKPLSERIKSLFSH